MKLLAETLRAIDAEQAPAYLESSKPVNVPRYEALGFRPTGSFQTPDGAREVTTMWREARAEGEHRIGLRRPRPQTHPW